MFLYFFLLLLFFTILSSLLFYTLCSKQIVKTYSKQLEKEAVQISIQFSYYLDTIDTSGLGVNLPENHNHSSTHHNGECSHADCQSYAQMLQASGYHNIWIVDENLDNFQIGVGSPAVLPTSLSHDAVPLVKRVFQGETVFTKNTIESENILYATVGTPVYDENNNIIAALLVHECLSVIENSITAGMEILLIIFIISLLFVVFLAIFFARRLTKPIQRIEATTIALIHGDYNAKTGVSQKDEIGQLGRNVDTLALTLKKAEEGNKSIEKMRREYISNISHELRTPITVIRGSLEALNDNVISQPELKKEFISEMVKEVIHLERMVNDLLELSRLQTIDFPIEKEDVDFVKILSDALRSATPLANEKEITLEKHIPSSPCEFVGDYGRLRQLLLIILSNGIKFSQQGGTIVITMKKNTISIKDHGVGIPKEEIPYIFDRFHKSKSDFNPQGSGLGLSIAKEIAHRHRIHIHVDSDIGRGTTFTLSW